MLPTKLRSFDKAVSEKIFLEINQKQELPAVAMFVNESGRNGQSLQRTCNRCFLSSLGSFGEAVLEKIFKNRPIRNKNYLWRPCLSMDRNKMSNLYNGPSIDASYQISVHLAEEFQRGRLKCEKLTDDGHQVIAKAHLAKGGSKVQQFLLHM